MKTYIDMQPIDFVYEFFPAVGQLLIIDRSVYIINDIYHMNGETSIHCKLKASY